MKKKKILIKIFKVSVIVVSLVSAILNCSMLSYANENRSKSVFKPQKPLIDDAQFISQEVPHAMLPGQKYKVSVTFKNIGKSTWTPRKYALGSQNPARNNTFGMNIIKFSPSESISTNQIKTFTFEIIAPSKGSYNFQWQIFKRTDEGIRYFGAPSINQIIIVNSPPLISTLNNQSTYEHEPLQLDISGQDQDNDTLSYSASNLPQGAVFDKSTHKFSWNPQHTQAGVYPDVHFEVTDGIANASTNVILTVLKTVVFGTIYEKNQLGQTVPLEGVTIDILDLFTRTQIIASGVTNSIGHFDVFYETWTDGTYFIRASKTGYRTYNAVATLRNNSMMPFSVTMIEGVPPIGTITINSGAEYTNSTSVNLILSATDLGSGMGIGAQMKFSNDNISWSTPEPYSANKTWVLNSENGAKTVYVKFKDVAGNWSDAFSDTIILDTIAPQINIISPLDNEIIQPK